LNTSGALVELTVAATSVCEFDDELPDDELLELLHPAKSIKNKDKKIHTF
jgi:hypothetical protein